MGFYQQNNNLRWLIKCFFWFLFFYFYFFNHPHRPWAKLRHESEVKSRLNSSKWGIATRSWTGGIQQSVCAQKAWPAGEPVGSEDPTERASWHWSQASTCVDVCKSQLEKSSNGIKVYDMNRIPWLYIWSPNQTHFLLQMKRIFFPHQSRSCFYALLVQIWDQIQVPKHTKSHRKIWKHIATIIQIKMH